MKRGFTLIELLVVVAVIAILMAVLLPSLNTARRSSRTVYCANLLRQIGQISAMYADENNDRFLPVTEINGGVRGLWYSHVYIRGEMKDSNLTPLAGFSTYVNEYRWPRRWVCPEATYLLAGADKPDQYNDKYGFYIARSYGANIQGLSTGASYVGYKRSQIVNPGSKLMYSDSLDWWLGWYNSNLYVGESAPNSNGMMVAFRHGMGDVSSVSVTANVAFFDGHVEAMKRGVVDRVFNPNNLYTLWVPTKSSSAE